MSKKILLLITGICIMFSAAFASAGIPDAALPWLTGAADQTLQGTGSYAVKAGIRYRVDPSETIALPGAFFPYEFEPQKPIPQLQAPEGCEISTNLAYELNLFELINEERLKRNLHPLAWNEELASAARKHSIDMACNDFFSHVNPRGFSFEDRIAAEGYDYYAAGENLYAGDEVFNSPYRAFRGWFYSSDHFVVMMQPVMTEVGIGYIYLAGSRYGGYFSADFASPE